MESDRRLCDDFSAARVGRIPLYGYGDVVRDWAIVDVLWADGLMALRGWSISGGGYARLTSPRDRDAYRGPMHRIVLGLGSREFPEYVVDHVNRNRLDNRLCNLRLLTRAQNAQNRDPLKPRGAGRRMDGRFRARVIVDGHEYGQSCDTREEALRVAAELRAVYMPHSAEAMAVADD